MSNRRILMAVLVSMAVLGCTPKEQEGTSSTAGVAELQAAKAQPNTPPPAATGTTTLFKNVRIFSGTGTDLSAASNVLVRGNHIERISTADIAPEAGTTVIDGAGRTLMPGLIDMHWHSMFAVAPLAEVETADNGYINILAAAESTRTLMRGFTTVRDVGGSSFALKRAVDEGQLPGPRIYPSGAMISVTSGHGDFRSANQFPRVIGGPLSHQEASGEAMIADSPDEVRMRVREQLAQGASQIKLTAGGGVSSPNSPLDAITFTPEELRAAVEAAKNWGTYVTVHAYTSEAMRQAIDVGVTCIEHGSLMDEPTAQLVKNKGVWLSMQPFPDELADAFPKGSNEWNKAQEVFAGNDNAYKLAKKLGIKVAFGTDVLFSRALATKQGAILASLTRWYTPAETLTMATSTNADLLQLSGKRNPYPGVLGRVQEGALADLLLVDGNPIENIKLVADPQNKFLVIMKNGQVFKNTLAAAKP
ncbi:amidohydrolase family protein [Lysobacter sp. KIS68-7]|uniref:metal-dependent hydrolase family protein n=1 Tax=Lysobacter sp. KIS68-7 TaxID=2904252 RepID=UPI001E4F87E3|nr:amidohydrolase family protein [Lysobacter sp. KIS68-7]UHQ19852.1 amidohydrolase family protein [Lysobacter sp. KIS68-7]